MTRNTGYLINQNYCISLCPDSHCTYLQCRGFFFGKKVSHLIYCFFHEHIKMRKPFASFCCSNIHLSNSIQFSLNRSNHFTVKPDLSMPTVIKLRKADYWIYLLGLIFICFFLAEQRGPWKYLPLDGRHETSRQKCKIKAQTCGQEELEIAESYFSLSNPERSLGHQPLSIRSPIRYFIEFLQTCIEITKD